MPNVVLLAMSDITYDARTINMATALVEDGCAVTVIGGGTLPEDIQGRVVHQQWDDPGGRALKRWLHFNTFVRRFLRNTDVMAIDVVLSMDFFALYSSSKVARKSKTHLVYDMREFYFSPGPLEGRGLKQRIMRMHEWKMLDRVNRIIVSAPLDAAVVQKYYSLRHAPDVVLNTPQYKDVVYDSPLRAICGVPDDATLLLYQGAVHIGRGIRPSIDTLVLDETLHLAIVGDGPARESLEKYARELNVDHRVHWLGMQPYETLHEWTCGADIGLCLIEPISLSYEYALPNKYFEYMMARIPVLATDIIALHDIMMKHPIGMLIDTRLEPDDILEAVRKLEVPATRAAMIEQCEAIEFYAYETQMHIVQNIVREESA